MAATDRAQGLQERADQVRDHVPGSLRAVVEASARHQTPVMAAGLAFFGLVSLAPAVGVGLGTLRLIAHDQAVSALVEALQDGFSETLGLANLLEQMKDRAGRYAGLGLLVLLWPATTLASALRRALDAVYEQNTPAGVRGVTGRLKGLGLGVVLLTGLLVLLAAVVAAAALMRERVVLLGMVALGAVALQLAFCLLVYRVLPAGDRPWSALWRGAVWATAGVVAMTAAFGVALRVADDLATHYPPSLSTAVVLGLWLYGANLALLLGAELNAQRSAEG